MGILLGLHLGVVLAMNGGPRLGLHAGGQPQPEAEKVTDDGVQLQGPVRLVAVQINRHRRDGDVGQDQGRHDVAAQAQIQYSVVHIVHYAVLILICTLRRYIHTKNVSTICASVDHVQPGGPQLRYTVLMRTYS